MEELKETKQANPLFLSPLQCFLDENCYKCSAWGLCDLTSEGGLRRMELCIHLYTNQPPKVNAILREVIAGLVVNQ